MQRRRLLTITMPEHVTHDEARAIAEHVETARRAGSPIVAGHGILFRSHDLGPKATSTSVERAALAGRATRMRKRRVEAAALRRGRWMAQTAHDLQLGFTPGRAPLTWLPA